MPFRKESFSHFVETVREIQREKQWVFKQKLTEQNKRKLYDVIMFQKEEKKGKKAEI